MESKTIKFNTCLSDDQDSDTIKFEDAILDSGGKPNLTVESNLTSALRSGRGIKESQGSSAGVVTTEIAEEEEKEDSD